MRAAGVSVTRIVMATLKVGLLFALVIYAIYPPEIKRTPDAAQFARAKLDAVVLEVGLGGVRGALPVAKRLCAVAVLRGDPPRLLTSGETAATYRAEADASGSINAGMQESQTGLGQVREGVKRLQAMGEGLRRMVSEG